MSIPEDWCQYLALSGDLTSPEDIWWIPVTGNQGLENIRLSSDQASAAEMSFYTQYKTFTDPELYKPFVLSLLGGNNLEGSDWKKYPPSTHPYLNYFYAKDIVNVTPLGPIEMGEGDNYSKFDFCEVKVSYVTLPYDVCRDEPETGPSENWLTITNTKGTNSRISSFFGVYVYTGTKIPVALGNQVIRPEVHFTMTIYNVPFAIYDPVQIGFYQGKVNSHPFSGITAAESVLFDNYTCRYFRDPLGFYNVDVSLNLIYNKWTWNKQLNLSGDSIVSIVNTASGEPPFLSNDLNGLLEILNPKADHISCSAEALPEQ